MKSPPMGYLLFEKGNDVIYNKPLLSTPRFGSALFGFNRDGQLTTFRLTPDGKPRVSFRVPTREGFEKSVQGDAKWLLGHDKPIAAENEETLAVQLRLRALQVLDDLKENLKLEYEIMINEAKTKELNNDKRLLKLLKKHLLKIEQMSSQVPDVYYGSAALEELRTKELTEIDKIIGQVNGAEVTIVPPKPKKNKKNRQTISFQPKT